MELRLHYRDTAPLLAICRHTLSHFNVIQMDDHTGVSVHFRYNGVAMAQANVHLGLQFENLAMKGISVPFSDHDVFAHRRAPVDREWKTKPPQVNAVTSLTAWPSLPVPPQGS